MSRPALFFFLQPLPGHSGTPLSLSRQDRPRHQLRPVVERLQEHGVEEYIVKPSNLDGWLKLGDHLKKTVEKYNRCWDRPGPGDLQAQFFDRISSNWRREQEGLLRRIQDIQRATPVPLDQAIDMLRLTSRASKLFTQQPQSQQRRLLQTVVEKAAWKDGTLQTALFEPFRNLAPLEPRKL